MSLPMFVAISLTSFDGKIKGVLEDMTYDDEHAAATALFEDYKRASNKPINIVEVMKRVQELSAPATAPASSAASAFASATSAAEPAVRQSASVASPSAARELSTRAGRLVSSPASASSESWRGSSSGSGTSSSSSTGGSASSSSSGGTSSSSAPSTPQRAGAPAEVEYGLRNYVLIQVRLILFAALVCSHMQCLNLCIIYFICCRSQYDHKDAAKKFMASRGIRMIWDSVHRLWYLVGDADRVNEAMANANGQYETLPNPWLSG